MHYTLKVDTESDDGRKVVRLRLLDPEGGDVAERQVEVKASDQAMWEGLFDTRSYVGLYEGTQLWEGQDEPATAGELMDRLGVYIGQEVLGAEIMAALLASSVRRTLLVHLPATEADSLAAAFARVPWEIARAAAGEPQLAECALVVRAMTESTRERDELVAAVAGEVASGAMPLRVLLVFAEAPGSRPLAARLERERLMQVFAEDILPGRNVEVDVLCHGVTRELLVEQIKSAGGYHIVHWSGHGFHDWLEILGENGKADHLAGKDLVELIERSGGFVPQLVFLSACMSGSVVRARNVAELLAAMRREAAGQGGSVDPQRRTAKQLAGDAEKRPLDDTLEKPSGYTGTALALVASGVQQVVAMRYSVGDRYARELALRFYRHLLVDRGEPPTDSALAMARDEVLRDAELAGKVWAVDHANPLLFGQGGRVAAPVARGNAPMQRIRPRPQPLLPGGSRELGPRAWFVGRGEPLTGLHREWLTRGRTPAVALVQGLGGLGKTALAAEVIHLWHRAFDWVLAFQGKPTALTVEQFYREVDNRLTLESATYRKRCEDNPYARTFLEAGKPLAGEARLARMQVNLIEVLRGEAVLLVLDNVETMLEDVACEAGYACADPTWDRLFEALARELPATGSRLLITSRHRLAALADPATCRWLPLGPLPPGEATLYLRNHDALSALVFGDAADDEVLEQVIRTSRGHPLILDRLAAVAGDRSALLAALEQLEREGMKALPDVFSRDRTDAEREAERTYLEDVAVGSVDLLLGRLSADARQLLWIVSLANEPVTEAMLQGVWAEGPDGAGSLAPLVAALHGAGLVSVEAGGGPDSPRTLAFHELVRERARVWMDAHPDERGGRTAEAVWMAYGERYAARFKALRGSGQDRTRPAAAEAGRCALVYYVRARDFAALGGFASRLVTSTMDPVLLRGVIAELEAVADTVPDTPEHRKARWCVRTYLADALKNAGQPNRALALFEQAASEAEAAGHRADVAWITGNWAVALTMVGHLDAARSAHLRSAEAERKAGRPRADVIGRELEALRIDVMHGKAADTLPAIEGHLAEARTWWQRHRAGESVPEAPDAEFLGRLLVSGLDIARQANQALERGDACLALLAEIEAIQRARGESEHQLAFTRANQYAPLLRLGRLDEAQRLLEGCLDAFRRAGDLDGEGKALSALAELWDRRDDRDQAIALERQALAVKNRLSNPASRAISHGNLANYLGHANRLVDALPHRLAALTYNAVSGHRQELSRELRNLAIDLRQAAQADPPLALPRLADLLAQPAFHALAEFLADRKVALADLQADIDSHVAEIRDQDTTPRDDPENDAR